MGQWGKLFWQHVFNTLAKVKFFIALNSLYGGFYLPLIKHAWMKKKKVGVALQSSHLDTLSFARQLKLTSASV